MEVNQAQPTVFVAEVKIRRGHVMHEMQAEVVGRFVKNG
jgi:hypothetical protein